MRKERNAPRGGKERERRRESETGGGGCGRRERGKTRRRGKERNNAPFRERRGAAGEPGSIRAAFELPVAQYLEPFSRN